MIWSTFECFAGTEDGDDDGEADGGLCRGDDHDEEDEDLALYPIPHVGEGDEGEVDGVEHELDRHEDGDDVALDQEGADAGREEEGGEDQVPGDGDTGVIGYCSFRARTTAPRMATRMRMLVTSKGSSRSRKSTVLISEMLLTAALRWPPKMGEAKAACAPTGRQS